MIISKYINYFIFFLLPIFLIFSPFLSELIIIISLLFFIFFVIKNNLIKYYFFNYYTIFFLIWCLYLILLSLSSINVYLSLQSSLFYFRFCLFSLAFYFFYKNYRNLINYLFLGFFISITCLTLDSILQYLTNYNILGYEYFNYRVSSFFGDEHKMGYYSLFATLTSISILFLTNNKFLQYYKTFFLFTLFICVNILVVLSGERKALVLLLIFDFTYIIIFKSFRVQILSAILSILTIVVILVFLNPDFKNRFINQTFDQLQSEDKKIYIFSEMYEAHYITATNIFLDNKVFGVGPKIYREICNDPKYYYSKYSCTTHPHHAFLQLLSETGIVGTVPFIFLFFFSIYKMFPILLFSIISKNENTNNSKIAFFFLILAFVFILLPIVPSGNLFNNWNSMLHFIPISILLSMLGIIKHD